MVAAVKPIPRHFPTFLSTRRKAIDCETTGTDLFHGCRMFACSILYNDGERYYWEWRVDPHTRQPIIPASDLAEIKAHLEHPDHTLVWHNGLFDVLVIAHEIPDLNVKDIFRRSEDTMLMHHVLWSNRSHKLKDIGVTLGIGDDDQRELQKAVTQARQFARTLDWKIANEKNVVTTRKKPKSEDGEESYWPMDMWLPAAYIHYWQELEPDNPDWQNHPWLTLCSRYCQTDTRRTIIADYVFQKELDKTDLRPQYEERRLLLPILHGMKVEGIYLHMDRVKHEMTRCRKAARVYAERARLHLGWDEYNPRSHQQVAKALYEQFRQPVKTYTEKGNPSTDKDALVGVLQSNDEDSDVYRFVLDHVSSRKHEKALEYLTSYRRAAVDYGGIDGAVAWFLHPDVIPTATKTTRFASSNPNSQNISKGKEAFIKELKAFDLTLRKVFGPAPGREWWAFDYKQLQLVLFAYLSGEESMIQAFLRGVSFHEFMARKIFDIHEEKKVPDSEKTIAKNVNFGFIFGAQPAKIERTAKRKGLWALLESLFPSAIGFIESNKQDALKNGCVYTAGGYRLGVPKNKPHAATNYIIQGTEGKIVQRAMILCQQYIDEKCPDARIAMQVHDELIFDFPAGQGDYFIAELADLMRQAALEIGIPCDVDGKYIEKYWDVGQSVEVDQNYYLVA